MTLSSCPYCSVVVLGCGASAAAASRRPNLPRSTGRTDHVKFTASTQLVVETVTVTRQERQADRRPDRQGFHHHRRNGAADHQLLRIPETDSSRKALPQPTAPTVPRSVATERNGEGRLGRRTSQITPETPGDIRYQRPPPAGDLLRHERDARADQLRALISREVHQDADDAGRPDGRS